MLAQGADPYAGGLSTRDGAHIGSGIRAHNTGR